MRVPLRHLATVAVVVVARLTFPAGATGQQYANPAAQSSIQTQQYKIAVQQAVTGPFRVDVQPKQQGVKPNTPAIIRVVLRNADNQEVSATQKTNITVTLTAPSRAASVRTLDVAPGASAGEFTFTPKEAGLWKLEAHEAYDHLKSGNSYLLVSSGARAYASAPVSSTVKKAKPAPKPTPKPPTSRMFAPRLVLAAYTPPYYYEPPQQPLPQDSGIMITASGEGDGHVRADGVSAARVDIFLTAPQSTDERILLAVSHGQLAQQLITIPAGQIAAETTWTSTVPVAQAKVSISNATPRIQGQDKASATVDFVDPIVAIAFVQPLERINIVELGTIAVRFVDRNAVPVRPQAPMSYSFHANSAGVRLSPSSDQTKPGAIDFTTSVAPTSFGKVTIEAAVPGLKPIQQSLEITGLLLLGLCTLGGALGGLVNHLDRKQKGLAASLVTGMVVALPVTWLYVWVGLPNISASILHNQLSAVMVAIIAGIGGASGLKLAAQKAGFALFDSSSNRKSSSATA